MLKSQSAVTVLILAISHNHACATVDNVIDSADPGGLRTSNHLPNEVAASSLDFSTASVVAANSPTSDTKSLQQPNRILTIAKTKSGIIDSDDFNDGKLDTRKWARMQHMEIFPAERDGYLVVKGTPSANAKGWWHAGAMTKRAVSKGLPDLVMAVKYVLPNWDYPCTLDWEKFPIYEAHLCNDTPDRNHSIQLMRMCPHSGAKEALFGGLTSAQMPKDQINNVGVEMFINYNDGKAQGFILDKDGTVHAATDATRVQIEDYKRMELKSVSAHPGVEVHLKVDWAVLYPQPLDVPVRFHTAGFPATKIVVKVGEWKRRVPIKNGLARVKLPANRLYPAAAEVKVLNGDITVGTAIVSRDKDLGGLYPGDTWKITK